jgi:hypothetical protein
MFDHYVRSPFLTGLLPYFNPTMKVNGKKEKHIGHLTDITGDTVLEFIKTLEKNPNKKPFFLQYWLNAPHDPNHPAPEYLADEYFKKRYQSYLKNPKSLDNQDWYENNRRKLYIGQLKQADAKIGAILDHVFSSPTLKENTIIFITSDNGGSAKTRRKSTNNEDHLNRKLRGNKTKLFDGGIKQPLFVYVPGQSPRLDTTAVSVRDIYPTIIKLAGAFLSEKEKRKIDGNSFHLRLLQDLPRKNQKRPLYWSLKLGNATSSFLPKNHQLKYAVLEEPWKLVYEPTFNCIPCLFHMGSELYSNEDASENLASTYPEKVKELRLKYKKWLFNSTKVPLRISKKSKSTFVRDLNSNLKYLEFPNSNNWAELENKIKFEINRLDFTFMARLTLTKAPLSASIIAMRKDSWILSVTKDLRLRLATFDPKGAVTYSISQEKIQLNQATNLAFTIFSFQKLEARSTLYIGESKVKLTARRPISQSIRSNQNTVYIGSEPTHNGSSFSGILENPYVFHAPLSGGDIDFINKFGF